MNRLVILFALIVAPFSSFCQADTTLVYTSLELAEKNPEAVYHLDLTKKRLKDFPISILKMTNLKSLILEKNKIDSIPPEIGMLIHLEKLNLSRNSISTFTPEICNLTNLTFWTFRTTI